MNTESALNFRLRCEIGLLSLLGLYEDPKTVAQVLFIVHDGVGVPHGLKVLVTGQTELSQDIPLLLVHNALGEEPVDSVLEGGVDLGAHAPLEEVVHVLPHLADVLGLHVGLEDGNKFVVALVQLLPEELVLLDVALVLAVDYADQGLLDRLFVQLGLLVRLLLNLVAHLVLALVRLRDNWLEVTVPVVQRVVLDQVLEIVLGEDLQVLHQVVDVEQCRALVNDNLEDAEVGVILCISHSAYNLILFVGQVFFKESLESLFSLVSEHLDQIAVSSHSSSLHLTMCLEALLDFRIINISEVEQDSEVVHPHLLTDMLLVNDLLIVVLVLKLVVLLLIIVDLLPLLLLPLFVLLFLLLLLLFHCLLGLFLHFLGLFVHFPLFPGNGRVHG